MIGPLPTYDVSAFARGFDDQHEVKGTYFYGDTLNSLFDVEGGVDNQEFFVPVTLVPEPDNPYSTQGHTISVRWRDKVIGHIASGTSDNYQSIRRVAASGFDAQTKARIWTNKKYNGERDFWIKVQLPNPDLLIPLNDPPVDGFTLLPPGSAIQVTKESDHIDVLSDYIPVSGTGQVLVTLHIIEAGVRKTWECIEVRLDGERVGELSKASSEKYTAAVRHFDDLGLSTVSRARIQGSSVAVEVVLQSAKSHELTEDDLNPTDYKPLPKLVKYQSDPGKYEVANRWPGETQRSRNYAKKSASKSAKSAKSTKPSKVTPALVPAPDWATLLSPDGTPQANLFQRGYWRGLAGHNFPGNRAPRIDYATVGQVEKLVAHYGGDVSEVKKRGGILLKGLWWILLFLLAIVALVGLITAPGGLIVTALVIFPFAHHYITRRKLESPFGKQQ